MTGQDANRPQSRQPPKDCDKDEEGNEAHDDEHVEGRAHDADGGDKRGKRVRGAMQSEEKIMVGNIRSGVE